MRRSRTSTTVAAILGLISVAAVPATAGGDLPGTPDGTVRAVAEALGDHKPQILWHALPSTYQKDITETQKLGFNPEVTVRSRGVMEKCTYCLQRINRARRDAKLSNRSIQDGDVVAACQQACPTGAIVFGNVNDPESEVAKVKRRNRSYELLDELNVKPRTSFLARIRNPNPELEET